MNFHRRPQMDLWPVSLHKVRENNQINLIKSLRYAWTVCLDDGVYGTKTDFSTSPIRGLVGVVVDIGLDSGLDRFIWEWNPRIIEKVSSFSECPGSLNSNIRSSIYGHWNFAKKTRCVDVMGWLWWSIISHTLQSANKTHTLPSLAQCWTVLPLGTVGWPNL